MILKSLRKGSARPSRIQTDPEEIGNLKKKVKELKKEIDYILYPTLLSDYEEQKPR